jgi:hypothetical protein
MSSHISDNDNDLFDYDPDQETKTPYASSDSEDTLNVNDYSTREYRLLKDIQSHFKDSTAGSLDGGKVKLAMGFHEATNNFLQDVIPQAAMKSMIVALDSVTEGNYSLLNLFYKTEMRISRRMTFLSLFNDIFAEGEISDTFSKALIDILNLDFNDLYVRSCFTSSMSICNHALILDRATYRILAEKLDLPVREFLFANPSDLQDEDDHDIYYSDFMRDITSNINNMLANSGLADLLAKEFSTPVVYRKTNEK